MNTPKSIKAILQDHSERLKCYTCGTDEERIAHIISDYHNAAVRAISDVKLFRDDLQCYLRGVALVLDMTANASTHREKDARLRGAIELLESAIEKLRNSTCEFTLSHGRQASDIFRSDYPTRHLLHRIHELESELQSARTNGPRVVHNSADLGEKSSD